MKTGVVFKTRVQGKSSPYEEGNIVLPSCPVSRKVELEHDWDFSRGSSPPVPLVSEFQLIQPQTVIVSRNKFKGIPGG